MWLNSTWSDLFLIAFVYTVGVFGIWRHASVLEIEAWYGTVDNGALALTSAGWWLALVSLPIFQFLLLRWYFRLIVWWWILRQLARFELNLQPLHPDHAGGLGFLPQLSTAFMPLLAAQGALAAGWIANQIFFSGATLLDFKMALAAVTVISVFLILGPLLFFSPRLAHIRRAGLSAYGTLATQYASDFTKKWLRGSEPANEVLIGSGDIQSLADLGNSYATLREMKVVLFDARTAIPLAAALLLPVTPLLLTMISVEELLTRVLKILL